ncbi:MAG TPA: hypothetical protein PLS03_15500 [Terrimicrobiaceae bacterium]|nr:hypothetical protein [Terrimicrobiaceae bacterium]
MKRFVQRSLAFAMDGAMCGMMNALQGRRTDQVCSREEFEAYLSACSPMTREDFFRHPPAEELRRTAARIDWRTPLPSGFPENDRAHVQWFPCAQGKAAPTVLLLHALMSASDKGYRRVARWFNDRGWNAAFPHLPFHYSRKPRGYMNGELAITANLVRNAENIRQGVVELRQLMQHLRTEGCREFAVVGTSFGGWNGALLSFLETDFRFLALVQPIVNVEHAIWENPGSASMRRLLRARGIRSGEIVRHAHLSSPLHGIPLCGADRAVITAGLYDSVATAKDLRLLKRRWRGSKILHVRQGHFGYQALQVTLKEIERFL